MSLLSRVLLPLSLTSFLGAQCLTPEVLTPTLPACATTGFGASIAIDGDTAAVGAPYASEGPGTTCGVTESGRVFLFRRNPTPGTWTLTDEIANPIGGDRHRFGTKVAIRGNTLAALGIGRDGIPEIAWVLVKVGSTWQSARLTLPGGFSSTSIAISDDIIAIGLGGGGRVCLYGRPIAGWTSVASHAPGVSLNAPAGDAGNFGYHVALGVGPTLGPRLAVACDLTGFTGSRVYFYDLFLGQWIPSGSFSLSFPLGNSMSGRVDLHGDVAVFGHHRAQKCWVFVRDMIGNWNERWVFQRGEAYFGADAALSRDPATEGRVVVLAVDGAGLRTGFVYDPVDRTRLDAWTMRTLPVPGTACSIPFSVAMSGPLVVLAGGCLASDPTPAYGFYLGGPRTGGGYVSYGTSCQGTGGLRPVHTIGGTAEIGYQISWELSNARASAPAAVLIGAGRQNIPLDAIGMTGCFLHLTQLLSIGGLTDGTGRLVMPVTIPCSAVGAVGGLVHSQMAVVDFGAAHPLKVVTTNGMEMTIGGNQ